MLMSPFRAYRIATAHPARVADAGRPVKARGRPRIVRESSSAGPDGNSSCAARRRRLENCPRQHGRCGPAASLLEVVPQLAGAARVAQLSECRSLDLADPLARQVELLANLLERPGAAVLQPESELEHSALTA